jgi:Tfp pilus assembly protein PilO
VKVNMRNLKNIVPKTLTRREKRLIIALIIVIILCIIYLYFIPSLNLLSVKQRELEELKMMLADEQLSYSSLVERTDKLLIESKDIIKKIPNTADLTQFITELEYICETCDVQILSIEPQKYDEVDGLSVLPVEVVLNGDYSSLINVLKAMENYKRIAEIVKVNLRARAPDGGSSFQTTAHPWVMKFIIRVYYLPAPEGLPNEYK